MAHNYIKNIIMELMELEIVYGYMINNAPTEEARRMVQMNLRTVMHTKENLSEIYEDMTCQPLPSMGEAAEEVPIFTNFVDAARYAFKEETQVIHMLKELYVMCDCCYHINTFSCIIEHQLNAMRLLYLIG